MPRFNKILVLDMDETLIHSSFKKIDGREADIHFEMLHTYKRPGVEYFLEQVLDWFTVGIWTSAIEDYAHHIMHELCDDLEKFDFFYTRQDCQRTIDFEFTEAYFLKDIKLLGDHKGYPPESIIVVDDTEATAKNNPDNLVKVEMFRGDEKDDELYKLLPFLGSLGSHDGDIRSLNKRNWKDFT